MTKGGTILPTPYLDCPQFTDPLAGRAAPRAGGCVATNLVIDNQTTSLSPGTYCGGLQIKGTSRVTLSAGDYFITGGPMKISDRSSLSGNGVSFYLDTDVKLDADPESSLQLAASKTGPMVGLLFFAARTQATTITHRIMSRNAQVLVGTIYMPNNTLMVDGDAGVGGASAYTAIVARRLELMEGPQLVLNTNYDQTDVPVPEGIRGATQPMVLTR